MSARTEGDGGVDRIQAYLDGQLDDAEAGALLAEAERDPGVREELRAMRNLAFLLDNQPGLTAPAYLVDDVMCAWAERREERHPERSWLVLAVLATVDAIVVTAAFAALYVLGPEAVSAHIRAVAGELLGAAGAAATRDAALLWLAAGTVVVGGWLAGIRWLARRPAQHTQLG